VFNIGPQELLLILLVALVVVGPQRLPELSRTIGRGLREFRKAQDEVKKTIRLGLDETEPTTARGTRRATPAADVRGHGAEAESPAGSEPTGEPSEAPPADQAADIARTLGRGLAEIRQARREVQRTFRVDLSDRPATPARGRGVAPAPSPALAPSTPESAEPPTRAPAATEPSQPAAGPEESGAEPDTPG
jgi:Tat protein translocase TatB subunit